MTEPRLQTWLKERYERLLERVLDRPRPLVVVSLVASVLAIGVVPFLGGDFLPAFVKSFFFGFAIGIVGCYKGFNTKKGTEGVGQASHSSVVVASLVIFIIDLIAVQITDIMGLN